MRDRDDWRPADTDLDKVWVDVLRQIPPGRKTTLVFEMVEYVGPVMMDEIRRENPGINEYDALRELAAWRYGRELAENAYPRREG